MVAIAAAPGASSTLPTARLSLRPTRRRWNRSFRSPGVAASASGSDDSAVIESIPDKSVSFILLSGGVGKRMGASIPKQYLPLGQAGDEIVLYSLRLFASLPYTQEIIVVCEPSYRTLFETDHSKLPSAPPLQFALPGKERQDSVFNGLQSVSPDSLLVAVHDGARPLVTTEEVDAVVRDAMQIGAAALGVPCKATIKVAAEGRMVETTLDRSTLWEMHTPQVVKPDLLRKGFEYVKANNAVVTDDASIIEALEEPVRITQGEYTNLKITTPEDMLLAERILDERSVKADAVNTV